MGCQKDIFMVMEGGRPNWWEVREGRVFLECGEKWGWMWSWIGLNAFPKLPPFSPIDCAPKNALNEAFNFEFEVGAKFEIWILGSNPLVLAFPPSPSFEVPTWFHFPSKNALPCIPSLSKGCGVHVGPPYTWKRTTSQKWPKYPWLLKMQVFKLIFSNNSHISMRNKICQ